MSSGSADVAADIDAIVGLVRPGVAVQIVDADYRLELNFVVLQSLLAHLSAVSLLRWCPCRPTLQRVSFLVVTEHLTLAEADIAVLDKIFSPGFCVSSSL